MRISLREISASPTREGLRAVRQNNRRCKSELQYDATGEIQCALPLIVG